MENISEEDKHEIKEVKQVVQPKTKLNAKDELIFNIKEWIKMDNDIVKLKSEVKEKTNKKKELTETLVNVMKNNSIDCFDIN